MKVRCAVLIRILESPHRGDSNEYTQYTIFEYKKTHKSAATGFFQGTQERVLNSRSKRAISVRATEDLLYIFSVSKWQLATSWRLSIPFT